MVRLADYIFSRLVSVESPDRRKYTHGSLELGTKCRRFPNSSAWIGHVLWDESAFPIGLKKQSECPDAAFSRPKLKCIV